MPNDVECTHCHVLMTSWSVPGSTVRYWQCPFCSRTHSSHYGEVFARGAGARRVEPHPPTSASGPPQAGPEEIRWARLKARAARWFQRLEQEQAPAAPRPPSRSVNAPAPAAPSPAAAVRAPVPARRSR
jgi:hypothetical protein